MDCIFLPQSKYSRGTLEACSLRDAYGKLQDKDYHILGVSADSKKRQTSFKEKHKFPYPLLADVDKVVINTFGVWGPKKFMGKSYEGIHRITFMMDENSIITHVIDKVKTSKHAEQILAL